MKLRFFKTLAEQREEQINFDKQDSVEFLAEHAELSFIAGASVLAINRHIADMTTETRLTGTEHAKEIAALSKTLGLAAMLVDELKKIEQEYDLYDEVAEDESQV